MKRVVLIAVIVIVAGAAWFLSKTERKPITPQRPITEETGESESVVSYTDNGYSPNQIRVKLGTRVTFKNEASGSLMWTASNLHPTHTILPEFDPLEGVASGQSYSFIFTKTGTWLYHNHLKPSDSGSVIVE